MNIREVHARLRKMLRCSCSHGWTASKKIPRHRTTKNTRLHFYHHDLSQGRRRNPLGMLTWWRRRFVFFLSFFVPWKDDVTPDNGPSPGHVLVFCLGGRSWASTLDPAPSTRTGRNVLSKNTNSKVSPRRCFCNGFARCRHFQSFGFFRRNFPDIHRSELTWSFWRTGWLPGIAHRSFPVFVCSPGTQQLSLTSHSAMYFVLFFGMVSLFYLGKWKTSIQVFMI